jgi:secondary thiamine-phosphate synthase enzyme
MEYQVQTNKPMQVIDITSIVREAVTKSGVMEGIVVVFVPHTTAAVTTNENTDPNVGYDFITDINSAFPEKTIHRHLEGNSHAHIKAGLIGSSVTVIIQGGKLKLGPWQGVFFCEFDGPRNRKVYIKTVKSE